MSGGGKKEVQISFDEANRIRVMDVDDFKASVALSEECENFTDSE
jgi:hypothetical protein